MQRLLLASLGVFAAAVALADEPKAKPVRVKIETDAGDIEAQLYPDKASNTVANFLKYVDGWASQKTVAFLS